MLIGIPSIKTTKQSLAIGIVVNITRIANKNVQIGSAIAYFYPPKYIIIDANITPNDYIVSPILFKK